MLLFTSYTGCLHGKDKQGDFPSKGLLEFLAEMEEVDGELISAVDLIQESEGATLNQAKTNEKPIKLKIKLTQPRSELLSENLQKPADKPTYKEQKK
jgi:hypothetical protein